jgi:hypothetical protein
LTPAGRPEFGDFLCGASQDAGRCISDEKSATWDRCAIAVGRSWWEIAENWVAEEIFPILTPAGRPKLGDFLCGASGDIGHYIFAEKSDPWDHWHSPVGKM